MKTLAHGPLTARALQLTESSFLLATGKAVDVAPGRNPRHQLEEGRVGYGNLLLRDEDVSKIRIPPAQT